MGVICVLKVREPPCSCQATADTRVTVDHQDWMERPLSPEYLNYASRDARLIHILFDTFTTAGWTKLLSLEESMRYVTFHKYSQPKAEDQYRNHSLLPLGILNPPFRKCVGCERQLPFESFAMTHSGRQCYVCTVITRRMKDKTRPLRGTHGQEKAEIIAEKEGPPVHSNAKEKMNSGGEFQVIHQVVMSY